MEQEKLIIDILSKLDDKVTAIDMAIRGDEDRGLTGIVQHMEGFKNQLGVHEKIDAAQFKNLNDTVAKAKWWVGGAVFAVTLIAGGFELISKFVK